eukprot:6759605-Prorocentrum_lima.AAC.1
MNVAPVRVNGQFVPGSISAEGIQILGVSFKWPPDSKGFVVVWQTAAWVLGMVVPTAALAKK